MGIFDFLKKNKNIYNDNGFNKIYSNNGTGELIKTFTRKNGMKEGLYKLYFGPDCECPPGTIKEMGTFKEDKLNGVSYRYSQNEISEGWHTYKSGILDGSYETFGSHWQHLGRNFWQVGNYKNNVKDGIIKTYVRYGKLEGEIATIEKWEAGKCTFKKVYHYDLRRIETDIGIADKEVLIDKEYIHQEQKLQTINKLFLEIHNTELDIKKLENKASELLEVDEDGNEKKIQDLEDKISVLFDNQLELEDAFSKITNVDYQKFRGFLLYDMNKELSKTNPSAFDSTEKLEREYDKLKADRINKDIRNQVEENQENVVYEVIAEEREYYEVNNPENTFFGFWIDIHIQDEGLHIEGVDYYGNYPVIESKDENDNYNYYLVTDIPYEIETENNVRFHHCDDFTTEESATRYLDNIKVMKYNDALKKGLIPESTNNDKVIEKDKSEEYISVADELIKLNELKEKGILTEDEFNEQKKKLLKQ